MKLNVWDEQIALLIDNDLEDIYQECIKANWDGYDASAVHIHTVYNAQEFLTLLPRLQQLPEIGVGPDGSINFEWYKEPKLTFSVSIDQNNILNWAGLLGNNNTIIGQEKFTNKIPQPIIDSILHINSVHTVKEDQ